MRTELLHRSSHAASGGTDTLSADPTLHRDIFGLAGELEPDLPQEIYMQPETAYPLSLIEKGFSFVREHKTEIAVGAIAAASLTAALLTEKRHQTPQPLPTS